MIKFMASHRWADAAGWSYYRYDMDDLPPATTFSEVEDAFRETWRWHEAIKVETTPSSITMKRHHRC